jgi:protein gp37
MAEETGISWCHSTFNPWLGCVEVSPACDNCYARTLVTGRMGKQVWGKDEPRPRTSVSYWKQPAAWNRAAERDGVRRRVFCGSLCDVMEDRRDLDPIRQELYRVIERTPHLDWLLLTKRPQNFRRFLPPTWIKAPRYNVWGMTTVENNDYHWRAWELLKTPFAVRGISAEPLLGPLDLDEWELVYKGWRHGASIGQYLDWVVCGGESGSKGRPMQLEWARKLRDQCVAAGVAFHFKQWGEWKPSEYEAESGLKVYGPQLIQIGKKAAGHLLDGREWLEFPKIA